MKKTVLIVVIYTFLTTVPCAGFHDGGVASCQSCHTIHNSEDGTYVDPDSPSGNIYLLKGETASDICLSCHANQFGAVFGTDPLNPPPEKGAGNFVFLLEDNINDNPNSLTNPIGGHAAGHSIVAPSKGVGIDPQNTISPGGTFPSNILGCTSCHDPHGNSNYRMLNGVGEIQDGDFIFMYPAPSAIGIDITNSVESKTNHTAYISGMSDWCANCHGINYHKNRSNNSPFKHDAFANFRNMIANCYNRYNGTDDPLGAVAASSYIPEVPFEDISSAVNSSQGPTLSSKINCLSCHRAHASSSPRAGRWDFYIDNLQDDGIQSGSFPIPSPYENITQTQLCYKCHSFHHMSQSLQLDSSVKPIK